MKKLSGAGLRAAGYSFLLCLSIPLFVIAPAHARKAAKPSPSSKATTKATTPKPGSAERKAIMDALRKPVQKVTRFPIIFRVGSLKMQNGWAFYSGNALHKDGKPINEEFLWGEMAALLRKKGKAWTVQHWGFATDVSVVEESKQRYPQAPRGIFPY